VGTLPGTSENWSTAALEVATLVDLFRLSGVDLVSTRDVIAETIRVAELP
jgi:hypothetical protein